MRPCYFVRCVAPYHKINMSLESCQLNWTACGLTVKPRNVVVCRANNNSVVQSIKVSNFQIWRTTEHWVQRTTFAAETNATRVQSRLGGHTHSVTPSTTIPSPLAKRRGEGNKDDDDNDDLSECTRLVHRPELIGPARPGKARSLLRQARPVLVTL